MILIIKKLKKLTIVRYLKKHVFNLKTAKGELKKRSLKIWQE